MSEDGRRDRRRVGDATLARIDDLADGWKVPSSRKGAGGSAGKAEESGKSGEAGARGEPGEPKVKVAAEAAEEREAESGGRRKPGLPPPSGSAAPRSARASEPPPPPPKPEGRAKRPSAPPPPPPKSEGRAKRPSPPPQVEEGETERDAEPTTVADPGASAETERGPRFEPGELGEERPRKVGKGTGSLRIPTGLPKQRGPLGDVRYVFTALFGVTSSQRELAELRKKLEQEHERRRERLVELARQAISDESVDLPVVAQARERLVAIEERRSQKAGAVAASDEEISRLKVERKKESERRTQEIGKLEKELSAIRTSLDPLEKRLTRSRRRAVQLQRQLDGIDDKIAREEAKLVEASGPDGQAPEVEASIAGLKADRESIAHELPEISAELDELEPKIASLHASKGETESEISELRELEKEARVRLEEKTRAVEAKKAVEEREVGDVSRERSRALRDLGESLNDERPEVLSTRLQGIEQLEVTIGTLERKIHELTDIITSVDRFAVGRGLLYLVLAAGGVVALTAFVLSGI